MERPIPIPRNMTALLQMLLRHVAAGHHYYCADRIPRAKLTGFIAKWEPAFRLRADPPARAYRKRTGRASVHLCVHPELLSADANDVAWWMLSTPGKDGLSDAPRVPGVIHNARTISGRLRCGHYELLEQPKTFLDAAGRKKTITTWTWRLTPDRYRAWEAKLVGAAKSHDRAEVGAGIECLKAMPMFSGVRSQVMKLANEANRMLRKMAMPEIDLGSLPTMPMIRLHADLEGL